MPSDVVTPPPTATTVAGWRTVLNPAAWTIYLLVPASGWGLLHGQPISPVSALLIALVWWAWSEARALPGGRPLLVIVLLKVILATQVVEHGWLSRQYANAEWQPPVERSTESIWRTGYTRRDVTLAFGPGRGPDLPLSFRNDMRFNFYRDDQPSRDALPYSVAWDGAIERSVDGPATFYVASDGHAETALLVDDKPVVPSSQRLMQAGQVTLTAGWHRIAVRVASADGHAREVQAGEIRDGRLRPFGPNDVFTRPFRTSRMARDTVARWLAVVLDAGVIVTLIGLVAASVFRAIGRWRIGRLLWLAAIAEALWFAYPWAARSVVMSGGDDWLTYEHLARAIAMGDPLLLQHGLAPGQGTPFYYQPLYPYFLALCHVIGGDSLFIMVFVQRLLLAAAVSWLAIIAMRLCGSRTRWFTVGVGAAFLYAEAGPWSSIPLSESLFTPLFAGWLAALIVAERTGPVMWTGVLGGLATLVRSSLLLGWPPLIAAWAAARSHARLRAVVTLVVPMVVVVGLVSVRNAAVGGGGGEVASSASIVLLMGNEAETPLADPSPARQALYDRLGLSSQTRAVAEYALQQPGAFARHLGAKAVYAVGLFDWSGIKPGYSTGLLAWPGMSRLPGLSWAFVALWVVALAGLVRAVRAHLAPLALLLLPFLGVLSHLAAVVIFHPQIYGDRLVLPMYPLLVPYAAAALTPRLGSDA